jgi:hypothetical protein
LVHGFWTQRWQTSQALDAAVARLYAVPPHAGNWNSVPVEVDAEPYQQARAVGYWMRRYNQEGQGGSITVILMCGRAGHMSVHTPDICYRGAGFEMVGEPVQEAVAMGPAAAPAEFWTARFRQPAKTAGSELRIYWAWSHDGSWQVPRAPRLTFAGAPYLYKLYLVRETTGEPGRDELTQAFLVQLVPELHSAFFSSVAP